DSYGGGIIFWVDAAGKQVLIAAASDQSTGVPWSNNALKTGASLDGVYAGKANTLMISTMPQTGTYAAQVCLDFSTKTTATNEYYDDWYLPSKAELLLLAAQKNVVGGFASAGWYWSSTELLWPLDPQAYDVSFAGTGSAGNADKTTLENVRCVRAGPSTSIGNLPNLLIGTQTFTGANTFQMGVTASSFTASGAAGVGTAKLRFTDDQIIVSSASAAQYGGVYVSTHVYLANGAKYYGDGSGLTNLNPASLSAGVAYLSSTQTFTGANAFASTTSFTATNATLPGVDISSGLIVRAGYVNIGQPGIREKLNVEGGIYASANLATDGVVYTSGVYSFWGNDLTISKGDSTPTKTGLVFSSTRTYAINDLPFAVDKLESLDSLTKITLAGGNVGIGTTAPDYPLHLALNTAGAVTLMDISGNNTASDGGSGIILSDNNAGKWTIFQRNQTPANALHFATGEGATISYAKMTILQAGNVGIGTTAPATRLHLYNTAGDVELRMTADGSYNPVFRMTGENGGTSEGLTIQYNNGAGDTNFNNVYTGSVDAFHFQSGGADRVTIQTAGNVGIGTVAPATKLHVSSGVITVDGDGAGITTTGNITAATFIGSGTSLTGVIYSSATGTYPLSITGSVAQSGVNLSTVTTRIEALEARISTAAYLSSTQTFTGGNTFTGNVGIGTANPESKLQIGTPYAGTYGTMPIVRVLGSPQSQTEETILRLGRILNPGPHFPASADFKMKAYGESGNSPLTQLTIALKSIGDINETANVDVLTLRDTGNVG
ncbi:MAG: hypothetical protein WCK75_11800, partial [Elusimicrobiota bacterium]